MQSQSGSQSTPDAAKLNPQFLKANASVHTWVFSAIAELIDNAYDAHAKEIQIDVVKKNEITCLKFSDNGAGMTQEGLFKMLSLGFTTEYFTGKPQVGRYGIGFKAGAMRLGDDALVFTRRMARASVGFLSLSYLRDIEADSVLVPILEYTWPKLEYVERDNFAENLQIICEHSPFENEEELKAELQTLATNGTTIYIFELTKFQGENELDLDFDSDPRDIQCFHDHFTPKYKYSLREYCSILFLNPRMKINLRGEKVKTKLISKSLSNTWDCWYKPLLHGYKIKVTFGLSCEASQDYGMMLYHRNRLIMAFVKLQCQKQMVDPRGVGVIGIANVNFLVPIHNKQNFIREDKKFDSAMKAFNEKLKQYVQEVLEGTSESHPLSASSDTTWVQCDDCLKWRRLPDDFDGNSLPLAWRCRDNPDQAHNRCDAEQEPISEDEEATPKGKKSQKRGGKSSAKKKPTSRVGSGGNKTAQQPRSSSSGAGPSTRQSTRASEKAGPSWRQDNEDNDDTDDDDSFSQPVINVRKSVNKSVARGKGGKRKISSIHKGKEPSSNMAPPAKSSRTSGSSQGTSKQADGMDSSENHSHQVGQTSSLTQSESRGSTSNEIMPAQHSTRSAKRPGSSRTRCDSTETLPPDSVELADRNDQFSDTIPQAAKHMQVSGVDGISLEAETAHLQAMLKQKDANIRALTKQCDETKRQLNDRIRQLDDTKKQLHDRTRQLNELRQSILQLLHCMDPEQVELDGSIEDVDELVKRILMEADHDSSQSSPASSGSPRAI